LGASAVLFFGGRYFARPPPKTMSKEWQELTNEYMKVSTSTGMNYKMKRSTANMLPHNSRKSPSPLLVFPQKVTLVLVWFKVDLVRSRAVATTSKRMQSWTETRRLCSRGSFYMGMG